MAWWSRLFGGARRPAETVGAPPPTPVVRAAGDSSAQTSPSATPELPAGRLLAKLLDGPLPVVKPISAEEQRLVDSLDEVLAQGEVPDRLLPRANAFVPQLMALLRQGDASLATLAERIAQDAPLAAEVLRAATTAAHGGAAVQDLAQAVQRIGNAGVQQAVARVVFRPIYAGGGGSIVARAVPKLWQVAQRSSELAASQARDAGLPGIDGYLAGLLHGTGWTIVLRVAERAGLAIDLPQSEPAALAIEGRAHRLFGQASRRWDITPGFRALGENALSTSLARSTLPLAQCLRRAQAALLLETPEAAQTRIS